MERPERHEALERLNDAGPPASVQARIVTGALARRGAPRRFLWVPTLALGAGAVAASVMFVTRAPQPVPAPVAQTYRTESTPQHVELGPHRLRIDADSELALEPDPRGDVRLDLVHGAVECEVDPLPEGRTFRVSAGRVQVEVIGTRFRVEANPRCTRVRVDEGVVSARNGAETFRLGAGQAREFCEPDSEVEAPSESEMMRRAMDELAAKNDDAARSALQAYRAAYPAGAFVEDSLFHQAVLEHRAGNDARALQLLEELRRLAPASSRVKGLEQLIQK